MTTNQTPSPDEMFDAIDATDAAADEFARDPQRTGSITSSSALDALTSQRRVLAAGRMPAPVGTVLAQTPREPDVSYGVRDQFPGTESREVGGVTLDRLGHNGYESYEVGVWDNDEGEFVHVHTFTREEAEALMYALQRELLG